MFDYTTFLEVYFGTRLHVYGIAQWILPRSGLCSVRETRYTELSQVQASVGRVSFSSQCVRCQKN